MVAAHNVSAWISHRRETKPLQRFEYICATAHVVGMLAGWFINAFVNGATKVLQKAAEDPRIDNVNDEARMEVKSILFHGIASL